MTTRTEDRERQRLEYIARSIALIKEYTQRGRDDFQRNTIVQDAVLRRLETLADATGKLSAALKARHPNILWRQVQGFRNIAAHAYEGIDLTRVWEIVDDYLPALAAAVAVEVKGASAGGDAANRPGES